MTVPPIDEPTEARTVEGVLYDAANFQYDDLDGDDRIEPAVARALSIRAEVAGGSLLAAFALGVLTTVVVLTLRDRLDD
ncbi:MAG: hypothetical protein ACI9YM_001690 [Brevundimonas sp.]|jgi:hypothetical protein|uniref:hypothetical protein n=1 Tax=Brevundimonas sp. TaxID=1871086 RepID=UPI0024879A87|nr:hypothetical protein [Brevundimonas sp.]MDI1282635.1 hypothetical protein [Brevundimonas sp.]